MLQKKSQHQKYDQHNYLQSLSHENCPQPEVTETCNQKSDKEQRDKTCTRPPAQQKHAQEYIYSFLKNQETKRKCVAKLYIE